MKRLMILAASVAAMAACTKTQVVYDDNDVEIGLSPVTYMTTKAEYYGPYDEAKSYSSNTEQFYVWAAYTSDDAGTTFRTAVGLNQDKYLDGVTFGKNADNVWGGTPHEYYWPKTGSLYFAACSPADGVYISNASYDFNTGAAKMTLDFTQGDYSHVNSLDAVASNSNYKMVDLLYFDVTPDTQSVNSGTYSIQFKHALSWITFKVNCGEGYDNLFKISKITLNGVSTKETFTSGTNADTPVDGWPSPAWTANGEKKSLEIYTNESPEGLTTDGFIVEGLLIIPQEVPSVTFEYQQKAGADQTAYMPAQSATVNIAGTKTVGESGVSVNSWEINKHYTYTLTFKPDEILISPEVDNWQSEEMTSVEVK